MPDELTMDSGALIFATLADVYLSSGMIDEAISILNDGLSRNPTYTLAKIILGRAYYMKGNINEAIKILEENYDEAQRSESANLYLGHCYRQRGDDERAIHYYNAALKINPNNKEVQAELALLLPEGRGQPPAEEKVLPVKPFVEKIEPQEPVVEKVEPEQPVAEKAEYEVELVQPKEEEVEPAQPVAEKAEAVEPPQETIEPVPPSAPLQAEREKVEFVPEAPPTHVFEEAPVAPTSEPSPTYGPVPEKELIQVETPEAAVELAVAPLSVLEKPMGKLLAIKSVKGAIICSKDGLLIQDYSKGRTDIDEMCAMIAAIHNEAEQSFKFLKQGSVEKFIIAKESETIYVITAGESLLIIITQPETKVGLIFVYARKIIDEIKEILG